MKKRMLGMFLSVLIGGSLASGFVACGSGSENGDSSSGGGSQPPATEEVKQINADLLDGKIANFMGAQGIGILDKNLETESVIVTGDGEMELSPVSLFGANTRDGNANENITVQKKNELVKTTENGCSDVYFHEKDENIRDYGDLNKQFESHHHQGEACSIADCNKISDELALQEQNGEAETIISLGARINKLYNYGNWTFFSVSSAVEGEVRIATTTSIQTPQRMAIGDETVIVNMGSGVAAAETGVSFIYVSNGAIPVKRIESDQYFHMGNYWSDAYNQSYVTDNTTGKTYSLSQFPRIYSVEGGIIKVYNEQANGGFDYYKPMLEENGLAYQKIVLPDGNETPIPVRYDENILKTDKYGHYVIESKIVINDSVDQTYDAHGEKKIGDNMIVSALPVSMETEIRNQYGDRRMADLFIMRYKKAKRYHLGSDGRIYRLNFKGNLSDITVSVLNENCEWQDVENDAVATFEGTEGFVLWNYSENVSVRDYFCLTKIERGYAYYASAALTDGGRVWDSHWMDNNTLEYGEYCGVVKIPVGGTELDESVRYAHLEEFAQYIARFGCDYTRAYKAFLIGDTQVLYFLGAQSGEGEMLLKDVATGESKSLGQGKMISEWDEYSIKIEGKGWLSLKEEIDFSTFDINEVFTPQPKNYRGLDGYFLLITERN